MNKIWVTAVREFKSTALTPAFIIGTFGIPVIFYAVIIVALASGALEGDRKAAEGTIGVIDRSEGDVILDDLESFFEPETLTAWRQRQIDNRVERQLAQIPEVLQQEEQEEQIRRDAERRYAPVGEVTIERLGDDADEDALRQRVRDGELLAVIIFPAEVIDDPLSRIEVIAPAEIRDEVADRIEDGAQEAVIDQRFSAASIDRAFVREISKWPSVNRVTLTEGGETNVGEMASKIIPIAALVLLFMAVFTGSGYLLMSTVEEKSSRVMEVLLSAISPSQLMAGKIVGQALVGFTILAVYGGFGLAAAQQFKVAELISPIALASIVVYFVLGYFTFAAVLAAIGASVNEMREAQAMQGPVLGGAILVVYLGLFAAMEDPNSMVTRVLSWVPLASPFIMTMRVGSPSDPPPMFEVLGTMVVGAVTVAVLIWASAKIFRIGVLMYGKPPGFRDLLKMLRYA